MLPIENYLDTIEESVKRNSVVLLRATPGSGKTTRVPDYLNQKSRCKILVLEPRRVAATSSAEFIAKQRNQKVGNQIGYQVRFEASRSEKTEILFITEALLLKFLKDDPFLKNWDIVIIDEFHERAVYTDISIGLLKSTLVARLDLKLIVMSATVQEKDLKFLFPELVTLDIPGLVHHLELRYDNKPQLIRIDSMWYRRMESLVIKAFLENPNDSILVFVPGRGECERLQSSLKKNQSITVPVLTLHGQMKLSDQRQVLESNLGPRIIISTNVAESSVTVPGVRVVVDSGLERVASYHEDYRLSQLQVKRISLASHKQRSGRAARLGPGKAFLAWIKADELSMKADIEPEIINSDIRSTVLWLFSFGVKNLTDFDWLTLPKIELLNQAKLELKEFGLIDHSLEITNLGKLVSMLPFDFDGGRFIALASAHPNYEKLLPFAVFVAESQRLVRKIERFGQYSSDQNRENDLLEDLENLLLDRNLSDLFLKVLNQAIKITQGDSAPFYESRKIQSLISDFDSIKQDFITLFLKVYPFRLGVTRESHPHKLLLSNGKGAEFKLSHDCVKSKFFLCLDLTIMDGKAQVTKIIGLNLEEILTLPQEMLEIKKEQVQNLDAGQTVESEKIYFQKLLLKEKNTILNVNRSDVLLKKIRSNRDIFLKSCTRLNQDLKRWEWWRLKTGQDSLMPLLLDLLIEEAVLDHQSEEALLDLDWEHYFFKLIEYPTMTKFKDECPMLFTSPNGKKLRLEYDPQSMTVEVEILLRDLFGLKSHPKILDVPIRFIILGPHHRPIQITQDIQKFWSNSYLEIRKEMRGRYPKQPWPEDPIQHIEAVKIRS